MAELRRYVSPRATFVAGPRRLEPEVARPRHPVARAIVAAGRLILAPFAALTAALAGLVFVLLLPICGIASLAEGLARSCWDAVKMAFSFRGRGAMSQH